MFVCMYVRMYVTCLYAHTYIYLYTSTSTYTYTYTHTYSYTCTYTYTTYIVCLLCFLYVVSTLKLNDIYVHGCVLLCSVGYGVLCYLLMWMMFSMVKLPWTMLKKKDIQTLLSWYASCSHSSIHIHSMCMCWQVCLVLAFVCMYVCMYVYVRIRV